ncbi:hypothetical protein DFR70_11531 [Nocardia tenerifensis]|uniref:Uncharacterized protein n=1 Tax=Nocardia tenerifensis TaxID=228006 RepID=A0A318JUX5_9NOCA|nr:hypothetical protein DFR70_11531 [Nocardia tenerifensis]
MAEVAAVTLLELFVGIALPILRSMNRFGD